MSALARGDLNGGTDAVFLVGDDGCIQAINPAAEAMLRSSAADILQRPIQDCLPGLEAGGGTVLLNGRAVQVSSSRIQVRDETLTFVCVRRVSAGERVEQLVSVLRDPLMSLRGSLGLMLAGLLGTNPEKARRLLELSLNHTDRLIRLISDTLDLERIESGQVHMDKRHIDLQQTMLQAAEVMGPMAAQRDIRVQVLPVSAILYADADRLLQVLTNLLSNALNFSPAGGEINLSGSTDDGEVRIVVRDRGRGIPAARLEAVFERFVQDSREDGGTGLGLSICRSIVHHHGGRIWAEAPPDGGTRMCLALPLSLSTHPDPPPSPSIPDLLR